MDNAKCECGHVNPHGTVFCEACGKALYNKEEKLLDMRYEGKKRRSEKYNRTIIDKIWNFFSSVKVGVTLIVLALIASAIGTILPQEGNISSQSDPGEYYRETYGWFGELYYLLGFHNLYGSWWYMLLIAFIGVSLVVCSLDRAVPLYKALKNQKISRTVIFLNRQRFYNKTAIEKINEQDIEKIKERLQQRKYRISEENGNILAEKGRFSRWGPYVNHIGLIIFLIGVMLRFIPGFYVNEFLWIKEDETAAVPGTSQEYYIKNHRFIIDVYDETDGEVYKKALEEKGAIVKNYQTNVTLYKADKKLPGEKPELKKVGDYEIKVNHPLKFDRFALYQSSYELNQFSKMTFALTDKKTGESLGNITIDLDDPRETYEVKDDYTVEIVRYFPDFEMADGEPRTKSMNPVNPAFVFKMITPDKPEGEISFTAIQQTVEPFGENEYKMEFQSLETVSASGITVRKDLSLPIIALGGIIFLAGLVQGSFWFHRRIWLKPEEDYLHIAGHTNKNWYGFQREIEKIVHGTNIPMPDDQAKK